MRELYEALQHMSTLAPKFYRMIIWIREEKVWTIAKHHLRLLLKPGKDPTLLSSYHPVLPVNTDLEIKSKALSQRLETIAPCIIHPAQTGFIKGLRSTKNTHRLLNWLDYSSINNLQTTIIYCYRNWYRNDFWPGKLKMYLCKTAWIWIWEFFHNLDQNLLYSLPCANFPKLLSSDGQCYPLPP